MTRERNYKSQQWQQPMQEEERRKSITELVNTIPASKIPGN